MANNKRRPNSDKEKPPIMNTARIPNTIIFPPSFTEYAIKREENQSIFTLYQLAVRFFSLMDDQDGINTYVPNEVDEEDHIENSSDEEDE